MYKKLMLLCMGIFFFDSCTIHKENGSFYVNFSSAITTTNPILATDLTAYNFLHNIHEGLMTHDAQGGIIPGLLSEVQITENGLVYDLYLKPNLKFSDGTSLTMQDVLESWKYALHTDTRTPFVDLFNVIDGAADYRMGLSDEVSGLNLVSQEHMKVKLTKPFFFFLELLANPIFSTISPKWREGEEFWPSVSGAYYIVNSESDGSLWLSPNKYHYAYNHNMVHNIRISFIENEHLAYQLFKQGELDWLVRKVSLSVARKEQPARFFVRSLSNGSYFILFNHLRTPYQDVRVRKALNLAINREELASSLEDNPQPSSYLDPFTSSGFRIKQQDKYQAQRLLEDAGFNETSPLVIHYRHSTTWMDRHIASYLQSSWQELSGVRVILEAIEPAVYRSLWINGDFDLIRVSWFMSDYEDIADFLYNFKFHTHFMRMGYRGVEFENLLEKAEMSSTWSQRQELLLRAQELLLHEDYAAIPLFHSKNYHLINTDIWQGFYSSRRDLHPLRYIQRRDQQLYD